MRHFGFVLALLLSSVPLAGALSGASDPTVRDSAPICGIVVARLAGSCSTGTLFFAENTSVGTASPKHASRPSFDPTSPQSLRRGGNGLYKLEVDASDENVAKTTTRPPPLPQNDVSGHVVWIICLTVLLAAASIYWYVCASRGWGTSRLLYPAMACVLLIPVPLMIIIIDLLGGGTSAS